MSRRILFVAMHSSPHTARWIRSIADQGWDLHLFPTDHGPAHPLLQGVTLHRPVVPLRPRMLLRMFRENPARFIRKREYATDPISNLPAHAMLPIPNLPYLDRILARLPRIATSEAGTTVPRLYGPAMLDRLIRRLKPDIVHSLEFQYCGYNTLAAKERNGGRFPPWVATNWGSDIYFFARTPEHRTRIRELLQSIDYYSCECQRDVGLARDLGYTGKVLPVIPNTGGFNLEKLSVLDRGIRPSQRTLIMVKGYQHFAGRALTALDALERCADVARNFRILVFSPSKETAERVRELQASSQLRNIDTVPWASHDEIMRMHARARIYLGVSISDAISTSMLEAMAMGAFPIQTNTSCCDEWIEDGKSGFIIPPDDVEVIADRIRRALTDDTLVDHAAQINSETVANRLDEKSMRAKARSIYDQIFDDFDARRKH